MKKTKKLLSLILSLLMVMTILPTGAIVSLAETNDAVVTVDSITATPGSTVDVKVSISNNPGILGAILSLNYSEGLTLTNVTEGDAFDALAMTKPGRYQSPCQFTWDGVELNESDIKNGTIMTLTFEVNENAQAGDDYNVNVSYRNGDIINSSLQAINLTINNGKVSIIDYIPGDVNGDKNVNMMDVILVRRFLAGGYDVTINENAADVNGDTSINMLDVIIFRRYLAGGWDVELLPGAVEHNHELESFPRVEATCTEPGSIAYWHCVTCGNYYNDKNCLNKISTESIIIPAKGHTVVVDEMVPSTYTTTGLTEGSHCSVCGEIIVPQIEIPKLSKNEYSINYYISNNDNYLQSIEIDNNNPSSYYSEDGLVLADLIVDGYEFKGWYTSQTGGTRVTEIPAGSTGERNLYAQWQKVTYTVTFDSPDVPVDPVSYTVDRGITLISPTWFGYTFVGWSLDGEIITSIEPGTTGNITLHANWTSNRNRAKAVTNIQNPNIIEDLDNGQYLFIYEIGTLENVPLLNGDERVINSEGIDITEEVTLTKAVNQGTADKIAKSVSNATTKTSGWTLSEEWNKTTSATNEHEEEIGKTQERTDSEGNVVVGKYYVSNSKGGSTAVSTSSGGSSSNSSKVTLGASKGINSSYGIEAQVGRSVQNTVSNTKSKEFDWNIGGSLGGNKGANIGAEGGGLSAGISKGSNWGINGGIGGKNTNSTTTSRGVTTDTSIKGSANVANSRNFSVGTESSSSSEGHWDTSSSSESNWNSTSGYESSNETSKNTTISNAISEVINDKYSYTSTDSTGGSNSETRSTSDTQELTDEYASTVEYSVEDGNSQTQSVSYRSSATGYYRLITAGTVHVFSVVGYDIATNSYFTYTYNILDKERHTYLDYSKDNANFNDCENGILPFEVPYEVNEYISVKTGRTGGLRISESTGFVTAYTGDADYVVIPEYVSTSDGMNKPKAVRVAGINSDVFAGNTNVKGVILPKHITSIPDNAFEGCTSLEYIFASGVNSIGAEAFKNCTSLKTFIVDEFVTSLGHNAFENTFEAYINVSNPSVAEAALNSGTKHLIICLSSMEGTLKDKRIVIPSTTEFFGLLSGGFAYDNISIESNAKETFLSDFCLSGNTDTPLKLNSEVVTLSRVNVDNSPGFSMIVLKDNSELKLYGDNVFSTKEENAIMTKNVTIKLLKDEVDASLNVVGNYLISGDISNPDRISVNYTNGSLIHITDEEFDNYLTSSLITFNSTGGDVNTQNKIVYYGQKYGELPIPTKSNYTFEGWYTDEIEGEEITSTMTVDKLVNQMLYAHWSANPIHISFNANSSDATVSITDKDIYFGDNIGEMPIPTREHYRFDGWFTDESDAGIKVEESFVPDTDDDIVLYAHWSEKELSDWVLATEIPENVTIVNQKWTYDLTEHKTSSSSTMNGWEKEKDATWVWGSYGSWSGWSTTKQTASESKQVETRSVYDHTEYHYYRWKYGNSIYTYQYNSNHKLEEKWFTYVLPASTKTKDSDFGYEGSDTYANRWIKASSSYNHSVSTTWSKSVNRTEYRYRTRSKVYTYYFKRTVSKESTTEVTNGGDISNVKEWVQYREK